MMERQDTEIPAPNRMIFIPTGERITGLPASDPNLRLPVSNRITELEPDT